MQPSCSCSSFLLGPITDWTKRHSGKKCIFSETSRPAVRSTQWWHLGFISSGQCGRSVRLSAHLCLVPTLRPHEPVTPLLLVPSRQARGLHLHTRGVPQTVEEVRSACGVTGWVQNATSSVFCTEEPPTRQQY
jgi:hypothetical protein